MTVAETRVCMNAGLERPALNVACLEATRSFSRASAGAAWFAVFSLPNQEARAERELANQSFDIFLPRRQRTIRHARRTKSVMAPLFPRYLFVKLDLSRARWRSIDSTCGVAHIVRFGELPAPVPQGVVEALIATSDGRGVIHLDDLLRPGQTVRLVAGPFAEQLGSLHRLDGAESVRILLDIMGRCVEVRTQRSNVLPA